MNLPDISQQTTQTGIRRALFEVIIAASAQQAMKDFNTALVRHMLRAVTARLCLELDISQD